MSMPPQVRARTHHREPERNGYDGEFVDESVDENFPGVHIYTDSEPKSRFTGRSRTSSGRRSRKTSSSSRELIRVLLEEKIDAERSHYQLERAYGTLRAESRRAVEAERVAMETVERLKDVQQARLAAQQEAARVQAELRMYKMQFENAQAQLLRANEMISQSDLEREQAERAMGKMRKAVDKYKEVELARRAREEGWRQGRQEVLRERMMDELPRHVPRRRDELLDEDAEEESPRSTASRAILQTREHPDPAIEPAPLPVPPPASVPIMPRGPVRASIPQHSARTPISPPIPRQNTPNPFPRHAAQIPIPRQTVQPPFSQTSRQIRSQQVSPPAPSKMPTSAPGPYSRVAPVPDHIIVRSPIPRPAVAPTPPRPLSRAVTPSQRDPYRQAYSYDSVPPSHSQRHAYHDISAAAASAASRIYSEPYSPSSSSSSSSLSDSPEFPMRPASRMTGQRQGGLLPRQEVIVPRPAPDQNFAPPRPPSARPVSSAYARPRITSVSSSTTTSSTSTRTETTGFPQPSRVAQLRHTGRRWSSESSSVPAITIEPPSRPDSTETNATVATLPSHLSPFGSAPIMLPSSPEEPSSTSSDQPPSFGFPAPPTHDRPTSRTGFRYGPPASPQSTNIGLGSPGGASTSTRHASVSAVGAENLPPRFIPTGLMHPRTPGAPGADRGDLDAVGGPPVRPGSAADYFNARHHQGHRPHHKTLSNPASNAETTVFHDNDTDSELDDPAEVPRVGRGVRMHDVYNYNGPGAPVRPPSRASTFDFGFGEFGGLDSPAQSTASAARRVPLPDSRSASVSAYGSHSGHGGSARPGGRGGSIVAERGRPASRTACGNTPFVRSSGLFDD